ncbi:MAG: hypothetical protein JST01_24650 [Cyanobacteria bacterium SZAS TMP-1]|nr:hypothetical protein [Cyanobacteria bacterium SZAS TMP-1]
MKVSGLALGLLLSLLADSAAWSKSPAVTANAPKASPQVWLLKQTSAFMGQYDVYISPAGLRAEGVRSHMVIVARPPKWEIRCFNSNAHTYWTGPLNQFSPGLGSQRLLTSVGGIPCLSSITFPKSENYEQQGLKGKRFFTDDAWRAKQIALWQNGTLTKFYPRSATYFCAGEIVKDPKPAMILEHLFDTPRQSLIPVEYKYEQMKGNKRTVLLTISARQVAAPSGWLEVPPGLRTATSVEEVNMDSMSQQGMDQMLDNIRTPK